MSIRGATNYISVEPGGGGGGGATATDGPLAELRSAIAIFHSVTRFMQSEHSLISSLVSFATITWCIQQPAVGVCVFLITGSINLGCHRMLFFWCATILDLWTFCAIVGSY